MLLKKRLAYCGGLSTLLLSLNVSAGGVPLQEKQEQNCQESVFIPKSCSTIGHNTAPKITGVAAKHIKTTGVINDFTVKFQVKYTAEVSKSLPTPEAQLRYVPVCGKTEGMLHCSPLELNAIIDTNKLYQKGDQIQIVNQCEQSNVASSLTHEGAQVVEIIKTYKEENELILEFQFTRGRMGDSEEQEYVGEAARQLFNMHLDRINSSVGTTTLLGDIWNLCQYSGDLSGEEIWSCTKQVSHMADKNAQVSCNNNNNNQVSCDQSLNLVSKEEVAPIVVKERKSHRSSKSTK
jgi:hypothetical protein